MHRPALLALLSLSAALAAVEVPPPAALPDATSFAVAVVPDLRATLAHVEAAAKALGAPLPPGMLAGQIGGAFGDPGLANLGTGPLVAIVGPGVPLPVWAVVVPVAQPEPLAAAVTRMGMTAEAVAGAVVVAQTIDGVALGKAVAPQIAALAPAKPAADIRLLVASDRLATTYLPFLLALMQNAQPRGQPAMDPKIMAGLGAILRILAVEAGAGQVDLALSADGLKIDWTGAPKAGGILAKGLVAPPPAAAKPLAGRFGASDGHLVLAGRVSPELVRAAGELTARVAADPQGKELVSVELADLLRDWSGVATGEMVMAQGIGGKVAAQEAMYGITDPAKAAALADRGAKLMATGQFAELYARMGMTLKLDTAVRKGPAGERIDRMAFAIDPAKAPPGAGDMWKAMLQPNEIGLGRDAIVMAGDPAIVDVLLGAGRGPCTIAAERTLGPSWDGYVDYDLGKQMRAQAAVMPAPASALFADMPVGHPLAIAWAIRDGRARIAVEVPMALAKDMKDHFAKANQQRRRPVQDGAAPVNAPPPAF